MDNLHPTHKNLENVTRCIFYMKQVYDRGVAGKYHPENVSVV